MPITLRNAGTVTITAFVAGDDYYDAASPVQQPLTVNKAPLSATADNKNRLYGADHPAFTVTYSGFKNSDNLGSLSQTPTADCEATPTSAVGDYPIVLSGGEAQNYNFTFTNGTLTINKATVTITALPASSVYGDTPPTFTCQYEGFANNETEAVLTTPVSLICSANAASGVGNYSIIPSGAAAQNYSFIYRTGTLTVSQSPLTIAACNTSRPQGQANPVFTFSYSGFKNNENYTVLDELPVASCVADENSVAGFYEIVLSGGHDNNYSYTLINGTLEVTSPTGMDDIRANPISVYPNPTQNEIFIQSDFPIEKVEIFSLTGVLLLLDNNFIEKISVSALPRGVYLLKVYTGKGLMVSKVVKE